MDVSFEYTRNKALYKMIISKKALKDVIELMNFYRTIEKTLSIEDIERLLYIVFEDYSEDIDIISNNPNILFIELSYNTKQWVSIAHELIHYLQKYLYLFCDDWIEPMALSLQNKVKDIICDTEQKNMIFKFVTDDLDKIESFVDYKLYSFLHEDVLEDSF